MHVSGMMGRSVRWASEYILLMHVAAWSAAGLNPSSSFDVDVPGQCRRLYDVSYTALFRLVNCLTCNLNEVVILVTETSQTCTVIDRQTNAG